MTGGPPDAALRLALQQRIGHTFASPRLLSEALTHSSFQGDSPRHCNERLEFVGDRVLGLVIANLLYHRFPGEEVGALARRHAALVRREALVEVAEQLALADCVRLSRGEEEAGGRRNPGLLADACEALLAAVCLDGGFAAATEVVERLWAPLIDRDVSPPKDAKTMLQEWVQGRGMPLPSYRETERSGPPHAPVFRVEVAVEGLGPVEATGSSKRAAERAAAAILLSRVRLIDAP
ncbi:MAG: ribonuclease III [Rhodospirillales bacterium]